MALIEKAPSLTYTLLAGVVVFLLVKLSQWVLGTLRPKAFPPGPRIIPGLGNLLDVPLHKPYLQFHKWAQEYGDVVGIKAGTGNLVILNSPALVYELFDKRGAICSDRPDSYVISKHVAYGEEEKQIAILQYDDYYKRWRKALQYILSAGGVKRVLPLLEAEACSLTHKMLNGGDKNYVENLQHWAFAVPLVITVGERLKDLPPEYMQDFFHAQEEILGLAIPGVAPPVDIFPVFKYVPEFCCGWKKHAQLVRKLIVGDATKFLKGGQKQYAQIQKDSASVKFQSLLAKIMVDQAEGESKQKHFTTTELGFAGQGMVAAAVDTTAATIKNLLVTFAAYPDVLKKAQEEVDRVGNGAPPTSDHIGELTYIRACISEVGGSLNFEEDATFLTFLCFHRSSDGAQPPRVPSHTSSLKTKASAATYTPRERCSSPTPGPSTATKKSTTDQTTLSQNDSSTTPSACGTGLTGKIPADELYMLLDRVDDSAPVNYLPIQLFPSRFPSYSGRTMSSRRRVVSTSALRRASRTVLSHSPSSQMSCSGCGMRSVKLRSWRI